MFQSKLSAWIESDRRAGLSLLSLSSRRTQHTILSIWKILRQIYRFNAIVCERKNLLATINSIVYEIPNTQIIKERKNCIYCEWKKIPFQAQDTRYPKII